MSRALFFLFRSVHWLSLALVLLACPTESWCQLAEAAVTTNAVPEESAPVLTLANRRICAFRASLDGYSPEERAAAAKARLESVMEQARTMLVTTETVSNGVQVLLDGKALFVITPGDLFTLRGQTLESKASRVSIALREALHDYHSLSSPAEVLLALGKAALGFVYFAALLWLMLRAKSWLLQRSTKLAADKTKRLKMQGLRTPVLISFVAVLRALLNFSLYLFLAFLVAALVWYELRCFPYTRPWGDYLRSQTLQALATLGNGILGALPGLMIVAVIALAARVSVQVLSRLFAVAEKGEFQTRLIDPVIAGTTRRIAVALVWIIAVVVAYPYIPGSQSLAFKGVTVFAGLVLSLGSTNIVNQFASGLVFIYSRAFRIGDYVRIGETEGTVEEVGMCVTHIRTVKNEHVHIANSLVLGTEAINYSRLARTEGVFLTVKVTIGYATPWRQVQAMLLEGARRTTGLAADPPAFVLQTALSDFYVEYELYARIIQPERRVWVLSELNQNIQDVFNEHGVQIMSPHYLADPPSPHVVPKSNWFLPPAIDPKAVPKSETGPPSPGEDSH